MHSVKRALSRAFMFSLLLPLACQRQQPSRPLLADGGYDRGPVIDSHTLITPLDPSIDLALKIFKKVGIVKFCNKNGSFLGSRAFAYTLRMKHRLGDKFAFFVNVSWRGVNQPGWGMNEARRLEQEVRYGAKGIKFFKALGLGVRDSAGKLIAVDDARLDPIMDKAAELNVIVAMHTGDPKAFFEPPTPDNERYDELKRAPDWSFYGKDYPSRMSLLKARERLIARHPKTTFLLIHLGNNPEDLEYTSSILDKFPNVYMDISARVPEIGRHPVPKLRAFFSRYQDRILFGTDLALSPGYMQLGSVAEDPDKPPSFADAVKFYRAHYRFLESKEKGIDHPTPIQGHWKINGIYLPHKILRKIYYTNADKLIFQRQVTVPVVDPLAEKNQQPQQKPTAASSPATRPAPAAASATSKSTIKTEAKSH